MKILAIGDIHGRTNWKELVEQNEGYHFVFAGDYCDPYYDIEGVDEESAIENLLEIIQFKKNNIDDVTLLIGNHDSQYLYYPKFSLTNAISPKYRKKISDIFKTNSELFQFSYQVNDYLFTHAGVTNDWLNYHRDIFDEFGLKSDYSNISDVINNIAKSDYITKVFDNISYLRWGIDPYGSLIWADARELRDDYIMGLKQVVGHNKVRDIIKAGDFESYITFIDCLFEQTKGLKIEI